MRVTVSTLRRGRRQVLPKPPWRRGQQAHRDPGYTCCQDQLLDNPASELGSRIDLVLARLALPTETHRVGPKPFQDQAPYWTSDHAAVVATIRLF